MIDQMREYKTLNMFFPKNKGRNDTILIKNCRVNSHKIFLAFTFFCLSNKNYADKHVRNSIWDRSSFIGRGEILRGHFLAAFLGGTHLFLAA